MTEELEERWKLIPLILPDFCHCKLLVMEKIHSAMGLTICGYQKSLLFPFVSMQMSREMPLTCTLSRYIEPSLVAQLVKNLPSMRETWVQSQGWEDPLEKGKATHSSILAWRIPWTTGLKRVGHDWATFTFTKWIETESSICNFEFKVTIWLCSTFFFLLPNAHLGMK